MRQTINGTDFLSAQKINFVFFVGYFIIGALVFRSAREEGEKRKKFIEVIKLKLNIKTTVALLKAHLFLQNGAISFYLLV
jgi:hypothetical protein